MNLNAIPPQTALKIEAEVQEKGRLEVTVPLATGTRVAVFVVEGTSETFDELAHASESSLDFWDNPFDDEDWNDAETG